MLDARILCRRCVAHACARMFAETRWGLAMSMYARLLGIAAVVFGFGLSEALPASDVWKGSWKFEIDRRDNPMLAYYDTRGRTIFRIYCGDAFRDGCGLSGRGAKRGHHRLDHDRQRQDADGLRRLRPSTRRSRNADRSAVFQPGGARSSRA